MWKCALVDRWRLFKIAHCHKCRAGPRQFGRASAPMEAPAAFGSLATRQPPARLGCQYRYGGETTSEDGSLNATLTSFRPRPS
jgi:hypothetical protein